ncbi:MAG: peptidylprolyl isomerase [Clostridia bacterium]|nr:peptidylprolyl isomerase [Clostridia bacterium]
MKKLLSIILCAVMLISAFTATAADYTTQKMVITVDYVNIFVNGQQVWMHNFVHEGTTYIGLRDAGNAFGYDVQWDNDTRTATFTYGVPMAPVTEIPDVEYYVTEIDALVDYANIVVDGISVQVRNFVNNGTTYVSLRDLGNMFNYNVGWDEATRSASLNKITIDYSKISGKINDITIPEYLIKVEGQNAITSAASIEDVHKAIEQTALLYAYIEECKAKYNLSLTEEDNTLLQKDFDEIVKTQFGGKEILEIVLAQNGITYDEYYSYFKTISEFDSIYYKLIEKINSNTEIIAADKAEALKYYNENIETFKLPTVRVKHILIPTVDQITGTPLSDKEKSDAKAKANAIYSQVTKRNANFESYISQNNNDPGMPEEGYYIYQGSGMVEEFETASLKLKANQISPVTETSYGYHIIKAYETFDTIPFDALYGFDANAYVSNDLSLWTSKANIQFTW